MKVSILLVSLVLFYFGMAECCYGSNVRITNATYKDIEFGSERPRVLATLTVTWENAWKNNRNHDAIWLFFKVSNKDERSQRHARIADDNLRLVHEYLQNGSSPDFFIPMDRMGVFISSKGLYRGSLSWRIQVVLDLSSIQGIDLADQLYINPQAIEMVYIPEGSFFLGDSDSNAQENAAAFFDFGSKKHYEIHSEEAIPVGRKKGHLYYFNKGDTLYKGDAQGPIPAAYPKGYSPFYIMKYELTEGLYVAFLNSIGSYYSSNRANFGGKDYYEQRGGISLDQGRYKTTHSNRPCNFISFTDATSFTDWAALRPITELEYEKACRGTGTPVENDFPWGTSNDDIISRFYDKEGNFIIQDPMKEGDLSDSTKDIIGASFYWVMDLNKGLWERCVTVGNDNGRSFKGTHGDGLLGGYYGTSTNLDWPNGLDGSSGLGYRGGGTYQFGMIGSPDGRVGHRPFGAWGDGPRAIAYGYRAGRTANE